MHVQKIITLFFLLMLFFIPSVSAAGGTTEIIPYGSCLADGTLNAPCTVAFDHNIATVFEWTGNPGHYIQMDFGTNGSLYVINNYSVSGYTTQSAPPNGLYRFTGWKLFGSSDNSSWTNAKLLDYRDAAPTGNQLDNFNTLTQNANTSNYRFYVLQIFNSTGGGYLDFAEWNMFGDLLVAPKAGFAANTTGGNAPQEVYFQDLSAGVNINDVRWDFGDGVWANLTANGSISYRYSKGGTYTVRQIVSNAAGSNISQNATIVVSSVPYVEPTIGAVLSNLIGSQPISILFDHNTATNDFSEFTPTPPLYIQVNYNQNTTINNYSVSFATNQDSDKYRASEWKLYGAYTNNSWNNWQLIDHRSGQTPQDRFMNTGYWNLTNKENVSDYNVYMLRILDLTPSSSGYCDVNELNMFKNMTAPVASFNANVTEGFSPLSVQFTDTSINSPDDWNWSYRNVTGNNTEIWWSTEQNPTRSFGAGNYTIVLYASNAMGSNTSAQTTWINVSESALPIPNPSSLITINGTQTLSNAAPVVYPVTVANLTGVQNISVTVTFDALHLRSTNIVENKSYFTGNTFITSLINNGTGIITFNVTQSGNFTVSNIDKGISNLTFSYYNHTLEATTSIEFSTAKYYNGSFYEFATKQNVTIPLSWSINADFTANLTVAQSHQCINFTDLSTGFPDIWLWNFGDGNTSNMQNPNWTYTFPGTFTISLNASKIGDGYDNETKVGYITVTPPSLSVDFSANTTDLCSPGWVQFISTNTSAVDTYNWSFGDGTANETSANPNHLFNNPGLYNISLLATGPLGWSSVTKIEYINASAYPCANFSATPLSGAFHTTVSFSDLSNNTPTTWAWDFGDGNTSNLQNPTHIYNFGGVFTVSLTAANAYGSNTTIKINYITIEGLPVAEFTGNPLNGTPPLIVSFADLSSGSPTTWAWDFGDGNTSNLQNPTHTFPVSGSYTVSLTVENGGGSDSEIKTDYIIAGYPILFGATVGGEGQIWGSFDRGNTVRYLATIPGTTQINAISNVGPASGYGNIILCGGEGNGTVWWSTDYGFTWAPVATFYPETNINFIKSLGSGNAILGTADNATIQSSGNGGYSWTQRTSPSLATAANTLADFGFGRLIIGTGVTTANLWNSSNYGTAWDNLGMIDGLERAVGSATTVGDGYTGFVGTGMITASANASIYKTETTGQTWRFIQKLGYESSIPAITSIGSGIMLAGTGPSAFIFRSNNIGETWVQQHDCPGSAVTTLLPIGNGTVIGTLDSSGVLPRSYDYGISWDESVSIPGASGVYSSANTMYPYVVNIYIVDSVSGNLITNNTLVATSGSSTQSVITSTGTASILSQYGTLHLSVSSDGYQEFNGDYSIAGDISIVTRLVKIVVEPTPIRYTTPHDVKIIVRDLWKSLPGIMVNASYIETSGPYDWLGSWAGVPDSVMVQNTTLSGYTGNNGAIDFLMVKSAKYNVTVLSGGSVIASMELYPTDSEYTMMVGIGLNASQLFSNNFDPMNIQVGVNGTEVNETAGIIYVSYQDVAMETGSVTILVNQSHSYGNYTNESIVDSASIFGNNNFVRSFVVSNHRDQSYLIHVVANTTLGGNITRDFGVTFPPGPISLGIPEPLLPYAGMGWMIFIGLCFVRTLPGETGIVAMFFGWVFQFMRWWTALADPVVVYSALIGFSALAVFYCIALRSKNRQV